MIRLCASCNTELFRNQVINLQQNDLTVSRVPVISNPRLYSVNPVDTLNESGLIHQPRILIAHRAVEFDNIVGIQPDLSSEYQTFFGRMYFFIKAKSNPSLRG